ncbi:hypothetical protein [Engelhardtia mirabilis]|uniref:Uncharacterized protein n=1 Tax=Engelhardtia mirabilis TaxID=2528011 RepID=A0A518BT58_9BACT|nr:hypothetical protein Pla133_52730 [Planctomycetes bacterium Pla133]QDV04477.1 hypothetical protein Pla86_52730 [Planctomycetes bacterium Pla86]
MQYVIPTLQTLLIFALATIVLVESRPGSRGPRRSITGIGMAILLAMLALTVIDVFMESGVRSKLAETQLERDLAAQERDQRTATFMAYLVCVDEAEEQTVSLEGAVSRTIDQLEQTRGEMLQCAELLGAPSEILETTKSVAPASLDDPVELESASRTLETLISGCIARCQTQIDLWRDVGVSEATLAIIEPTLKTTKAQLLADISGYEALTVDEMDAEAHLMHARMLVAKFRRHASHLHRQLPLAVERFYQRLRYSQERGLKENLRELRSRCERPAIAPQ